ncbi:D-3-phosphoglycerate dehydrogenase [hydrothermal vent metagenome]|uniref:D-3-phosphoglycerate dehydrogenase n=1 Tax=hydrothermal vent metagenome TaxID=652676 RepID=A0A3B0RSL3_9ZZZZ
MVDRIVVTRNPPGNAVERLSERADVWVWPHDTEIDPKVLTEQITGAAGLYCMLTDTIDERVLEAAPSLRVVSTMAVGVDNIDLEACAARGIAVGHTPDVLTDSTADMAWALLMASSRRIEEAITYVKEGQWGRWEPGTLLGYDVTGTTIGIIGMGRIGRQVARRAAGFDMDILYSSRSRAAAVEQECQASRVALDELLARSDHVVVCAALTDETRGMIDADAFARMKPTANLVNISRGPLVDTDALYEALTTGQIRCAGLDVIDPEPISPDHRIVALPNCMVIPHLGSATKRTRVAMADLAAENLLAGLSGQPMPARII